MTSGTEFPRGSQNHAYKSHQLGGSNQVMQSCWDSVSSLVGGKCLTVGVEIKRRHNYGVLCENSARHSPDAGLLGAQAVGCSDSSFAGRCLRIIHCRQRGLGLMPCQVA